MPIPPVRDRAERALESIDSTKLRPPRAARRLMAREALLARLQDARRKRCIVVQGPAGSGKTSTLVAWRQALLTLNYDVAWLSLASEDDGAARFLDCLVASLAEVDPALVADAVPLLGRDSGDSALEHVAITLVQAIGARARELVLMLDDLQQLGDPGVHRVLQWLLDYAPPNLHLAIGSRHALPLSLGRLRAHGELAEFDLRDLRFSADETERFLREQLGDIGAHNAKALHRLTDGWVAGLQLFVLDLKGRSDGGYAAVQLRDARAFADYFESEVLQRMAADDLALLVRAAVCSRFCASLLAALTDHPRALAQMTTRLARLDHDNLFIQQVGSDDAQSWYRLHPLLREVLLQRTAALPEAERRALHGAAWRWLDAHGQIDEAVRHAVQAGDTAAAAELVERAAPPLIARRELSALSVLMHRLPAEVAARSNVLRLVDLQLQLYARKLDAMEQNLRHLDAQADRLSRQQRYNVALMRAGMAIQRDDTDALAAMAPELLSIPADADLWFQLGQRRILAWMHMYRDEHPRARELLAEAEHLDVGSARGQLGRNLLGLSYLLEGRLPEAESTLREALQAADSGRADIGTARVAAGLLSEVLYELNELDALTALLLPRIELLERTAIPDAVLRALQSLALAHWSSGRRLEALSWLERLEDYGLRHQLDRPLAHALAARLRIHLRMGETTRAAAVLRRLDTLAERYAASAPGTAAHLEAVVERARADAALHWGDFNAAAARLEAVLEQAIRMHRWRLVANARLMLAVAEQGRGNAQAAQQHTLEALRTGHRLGLVRSLLDASPRVPALIEALLQRGDLEPVLAFYAQRLIDAASANRARAAGTAPPAASAPLEAFSEREREVLKLVAQALPNKKIARVLGVTPHTVKWHLRKIYAKLGVAERDEAVARMRDLEGGAAGG
ncbi:MAG: LuxR C-terminal-related transcriptional regulator [Proteobacteria bacterium]|nr:LuxR C-terminal-related transcriptional regulator [Pseudomonadota bacterium]